MRLVTILLAVAALPASGGAVPVGDSGLEVTLPEGWVKSAKKPQFAETFGAYESADSTASLFFSMAKAGPQGDMTQLLQELMKQYEEAFLVNRLGGIKTGRLADWIASFITFDAEMRAVKGPATLPFRFYLAVMDTGDGLIVVQGSCQAPVNAKREAEILAMLRSLRQRTGG